MSSNALARAAHRCGFVVYLGSGNALTFWDERRQAFTQVGRRATVYGRDRANAVRLELYAAGHPGARVDNKGITK